MDFYSTRYASLSYVEVNDLYQFEQWMSLSLEERLDALQELENRTAYECENLPYENGFSGVQYGYYHDGRIYINQHLVDDSEFCVEFADKTKMSYKVSDVNSQLMDTVHHENYHAYQDEAIKGVVQH